MDSISPDCAELEGIQVHLYSSNRILAEVDEAITHGQRLNIAYLNAHVLNQASQNNTLRRFLTHSNICYCDGLAPVWALRAAGHSAPSRLPGRIIIPQLLEMACNRGWRIAWLGGEPGIAKQALQKMTSRFPSLQSVWTDHGFHPPTETPRQLQEIAQSRPDVLLVGLGTPMQESWVAKNREQLEVPVVWCVGATADYLNESRKTGPKILLEHQEWLARLIAEPKRMWRRYLVGNPQFVARMVKGRIWKQTQKRPSPVSKK